MAMRATSIMEATALLTAAEGDDGVVDGNIVAIVDGNVVPVLSGAYM